MNLSFAGCGFLGIYHVGVAVCFKKYAPHLLLGKISGASFGALSACCLLCDLPIGEITSDVLRVVSEARAGSLGPFSPSFNIQNVLLEGMHKYLPHDVHKIVSGKLHISLTRVYDGKNVIVSEFPTREDLLQALLASCFVPVFSGLLPPRFHGIRYMDGGFSDNLPVLDENTITVSPFCGESDICPRDLSSQLFHVNLANTSIELSKQNMNRFARILFPPKPEVLSNMCKQGFDDALRFLHRNNMISCTRCLAVQSTFQLHEVLDDSVYDYDPECEECKTHRQDALVDDLPDTVMTIFQNAIESANSGLVNWLLRRRAVRCLTLAALPYRVPVDIVYATLAKFVTCTPKMSASLWRLSLSVLQQLHGFVYASHDRSAAAARVYYKLTSDHHRDHRDLRDLRDDEQLLDRRRASEYRVTAGAAGVVGGLSGGAALAEGGDTLEHVLSVTAHHDALLAYYYLDAENKMKMTEIFDVTDADTEAVQTPTERALNKQLEFDNDWSAELIADNDELDMEAMDDDALADRNIFSDPESEWPPRPPHPARARSPATPDSDEQPEADRQLLEHIDCERLAKTVNKRCVMLTKFMLSNLVEAVSQLLANTTLLTTLSLEGLPLKIPYLNPLCEALLSNTCLQHLHLARCLIGDAGCNLVCKSIRSLPNILTLNLSGCELTPLGAGYIADLIKYQKIHRYSENWIHTLRYRLPELDTMAGLRRITLCSNPQLGDAGVAKLLEVLADDLWIKALDVQHCGMTEGAARLALHTLASNTTLQVLDARNNDVSPAALADLRAALRDQQRGMAGQFSWLASVTSGSSDRLVKPVANKNGLTKDRALSSVRNVPVRNSKPNVVKKDKEYTEVLEEQLQEEISHRQQLEELNLQLVEQMKQLKQQQMRLWENSAASSGSEHSLEASSPSGELSVSSGSTGSVPIDQNTLSYIQQAFKDIYTFIKNNQCYGRCIHDPSAGEKAKSVEPAGEPEEGAEGAEGDVTSPYSGALRVSVSAKRAHSTHHHAPGGVGGVGGGGGGAINKTTQSAHLLGDAPVPRSPRSPRLRSPRRHAPRDIMEPTPEMFEKQMGDTRNSHDESLTTLEDIIASQTKLKKKASPEKSSPCSSSSDTLVSPARRLHPRQALYSSDDDSDCDSP
ncbi:uncharacterized protein LOC142974102 [Anticarsia gemmatalis]|uniref:uncharacterized protein LOC142974102 n=1 Tax=Anticarsia gemmatalis TaxID=129554 RepID=UPI003F75C5C3